MTKNIIRDTDAYKFTHWAQREPLTKLYSYAEPRIDGVIKKETFDKIIQRAEQY